MSSIAHTDGNLISIASDSVTGGYLGVNSNSSKNGTFSLKENKIAIACEGNMLLFNFMRTNLEAKFAKLAKFENFEQFYYSRLRGYMFGCSDDLEHQLGESYFIFGHKGKLYQTTPDYGIVDVEGSFAAVGVGSLMLLGAMDALSICPEHNTSARSILCTALELCGKRTNLIGGRIDYLELEG